MSRSAGPCGVSIFRKNTPPPFAGVGQRGSEGQRGGGMRGDIPTTPFSVGYGRWAVSSDSFEGMAPRAVIICPFTTTTTHSGARSHAGLCRVGRVGRAGPGRAGAGSGGLSWPGRAGPGRAGRPGMGAESASGKTGCRISNADSAPRFATC
eukprot:gene12866-biopygen7972